MLSRRLGCSKQTQHLRLPRSQTPHARRSRSSLFVPDSTTVGTTSVWIRRTTGLALAGVAIYSLDRKYNAAAIGRNIRTLYIGALIAADYKLNFQPGQDEQVAALHERVAERLYNLLVENGGLYIKIGQAIAANTALLPRPFHTRFQKLFDEAPQVPYAEIESVFKSEFGKPPTGDDGVFEVFEEKAVASASIAQVHRAKLRNNGGTVVNSTHDSGEWVAVKIQKPAVSKQVEYDLAAYRLLMWIYEREFQLPVFFLVDFISSHLRLELDFLNEARNSNITAALIASEPKLVGKVYVPKVYDEYTTSKVMTTEYIDGVKLSDRLAIRRLIDGAPATPSSNPDPATSRNWDGAGTGSDNRYSQLPIRGGARSIMETLISLFSVQIFQWGFVHCDPHPGNIIIRRRIPSNESQLVLIDHGLYVRMSEELRRSYAQLWKALLSGDLKRVGEVAGGWGIGGGSEDLLANGVLLKPWKRRHQVDGKSGSVKKMNQYERSVMMKQRLRQFLADTERFPQALVFLGRNMRMVQGNNQALGSPVNRVKIIGIWASRSLVAAPNLTFSQRLVEYAHHITFISVIFALDVAFWISKLRQWASGGRGISFEDEMEQEMRRFSKENLGLEFGDNAFEG